MQAAVEDCCAAHVEAVAGGVGAFSECRIAGRGERGETVGIILGMQCNGKGVTALLMSGVTFES